MQIEIRLIEKRLQLTKFQILKRTFLDFNGTVMILNMKRIIYLLFISIQVSLSATAQDIVGSWNGIL